VAGGKGDDELEGGAGIDLLQGNSGMTRHGGAGTTAWKAARADTYVIDSGDGINLIIGTERRGEFSSMARRCARGAGRQQISADGKAIYSFTGDANHAGRWRSHSVRMPIRARTISRQYGADRQLENGDLGIS
jgi:hypothetical protein